MRARGTAPHAPGIARVPRRVFRLRLVRGPSPLPGLVFATMGVLLAAAWVHPPGSPTPAVVRPLDAAVRRLRAAVVGDLDTDAPPGPAAALPTDAPSDVVERPRRRDSAGRAAARRTLAARAARGAGGGQAAGVPWWADSAHWGPEVIRWREATRAPLVVDAGDTITVSGPDIPALLPNVLRRRGVQWTTDGPALVLDAATGVPSSDGARRVVAGGPGLASVTATTAAGRTVTPLRVRAAVRGRLYTVDGAAPPPARVVIARRGAPGEAPAVDTAWTDATGRFRAPVPDGWAGTADVHVEPSGDAFGARPGRAVGGAGAGPGTYTATLVAGVLVARLHTLGIVLLPTRWTPAGARAGAPVPVRAAAARGFWRFAVSAAGAAHPVGWADDGVRTVAFDAPAGGSSGAPAADTAAFWAAARALGEAWGRPLFRPADPGAEAGADVTVHVTPGLAALGLTTLAYDAGGGVIGGAHVEFRTPAAAADPRVVAHELLHALGFGHARGWPSVLAPTGAWGAAAPTDADVAYGQLFDGLRRAARQAEREYGAAYGWGDATP